LGRITRSSSALVIIILASLLVVIIAFPAVGDVLYLPPYSPDFNPIEEAFAKIKSLMRKA